MAIFLYYTFSDVLVEEKKEEQLKISLSHVKIQPEQNPIQSISEPIIEPTPISEIKTPIKKKIEKIKKEDNLDNKIVEKKQIEKPIENKEIPTNPIQKDIETKNEIVQDNKPNEINQTKNESKEYLDRNLALIRNLINENIKYPSKAKKLSIEDTLIVRFKILSNGTVKNIEIIEGHAFFKTSTIEAIEEASKKFPKSDGDIEVQIAIEYKLI